MSSEIDTAEHKAIFAAIAELNRLLNDVLRDVAVIKDQNVRQREDTRTNSSTIGTLVAGQNRLEKSVAVIVERQARSTEDVKTLWGQVRENWKAIVELVAIVGMLTKLAGVW